MAAFDVAPLLARQTRDGVSAVNVRPSDDVRNEASGDGAGQGTPPDESWQFSRRKALGLMASALAVGSVPWATASSAAAATSARPDVVTPVITLSGAHTTTSLTVSVIAFADGATKVRVRLFNAATGAQVAVSPEQTIEVNLVSLHTFTGLTADTRYKFQAELKITGAWTAYTGEDENGFVGWCTTMPARASTAYTRKVVLLGCQHSAKHENDENAKPHSYDEIWADRSNVTDLVHLGDFHYRGLEAELAKPHVDGYKAQLTYHPFQRLALRVAGLIYTPSDHEAGPNNGESGGAVYTLGGHQAIKRVFPMHPFLVPDLADEHKDLSRAVACGHMLWVFPDFRNFQRTPSYDNFAYEEANPGDPNNKYRAYGMEVTEALHSAMELWRESGGIVVFWSDPVPYSQTFSSQETELTDKTDAYATYPATRAYLFPEIDDGIFSDYHNICFDDGTNNLHGDSGWFGCSGQWVSPTFRGGIYQFRRFQGGGGNEEKSVYASIVYTFDPTAGTITSAKTAHQTWPIEELFTQTWTTAFSVQT